MTDTERLKQKFIEADKEPEFAVEGERPKQALYWLSRKRTLRELLDELPEPYTTHMEESP